MTNLDHPYLRLSDLRRLRHMVFASRRPVEGLYAGRHVSRQRGQSVEFTDYRPYMPGDEIGDIDWKVFARSDKLFLKIFEHQSDMTVHLVLDASGSMQYPQQPARRSRSSSAALIDAPPSKYDAAARLAAALAFVILQQQDRVSLTIARDGLRQFIPPARRLAHLSEMLTAMEQRKMTEKCRLADALDALAGRVPRRGLVIVISDLLEQPEPILAALGRFTHHGSEAIVFQVLHRDELELPAGDDALLIDSETGERLAASLEDLRAGYRQRVQQFIDTWRTSLRARGIDHNLLIAGDDYARAVQSYLIARER